MPTPQTPTADEAADAREAVAARLERLARQVRASTTTDVHALDEAYSAIVKLAARLRPMLTP